MNPQCRCPDHGPFRGPHCRAAKGFAYTSDDWCDCACHKPARGAMTPPSSSKVEALIHKLHDGDRGSCTLLLLNAVCDGECIGAKNLRSAVLAALELAAERLDEIGLNFGASRIRLMFSIPSEKPREEP